MGGGVKQPKNEKIENLRNFSLSTSMRNPSVFPKCSIKIITKTEICRIDNQEKYLAIFLWESFSVKEQNGLKCFELLGNLKLICLLYILGVNCHSFHFKKVYFSLSI